MVLQLRLRVWETGPGEKCAVLQRLIEVQKEGGRARVSRWLSGWEFFGRAAFRSVRVYRGGAGRCAETDLGRDSRWPATGECGVR